MWIKLLYVMFWHNIGFRWTNPDKFMMATCICLVQLSTSIQTLQSPLLSVYVYRPSGAQLILIFNSAVSSFKPICLWFLEYRSGAELSWAELSWAEVFVKLFMIIEVYRISLTWHASTLILKHAGVSIAGLSAIILCRMNIVHDFSASLTLANFA